MFWIFVTRWALERCWLPAFGSIQAKAELLLDKDIKRRFKWWQDSMTFVILLILNIYWFIKLIGWGSSILFRNHCFLVVITQCIFLMSQIKLQNSPNKNQKSQRTKWTLGPQLPLKLMKSESYQLKWHRRILRNLGHRKSANGIGWMLIQITQLHIEWGGWRTVRDCVNALQNTSILAAATLPLSLKCLSL